MFWKRIVGLVGILSVLFALTLVLVAPADAAPRKSRAVAPLSSIEPDPGKLTVMTFDMSGPSDVVLPGAIVYIYDDLGNLAVKGVSDDYGRYAVMIPGGIYKVHIVLDGYKDAIEGVTVVSKERTDLFVSMWK